MAADPVFTDVGAGGKRHSASGFVCPAEIGRFDRDAVGQRNPLAHADYCLYSARDGVYGTVVISPLPGSFDPKTLMAHDFIVQEGSGGRMSSEGVVMLGPNHDLAVYTRTYDAARVEAMRYRVQFTAAAVGAWAVQATVEYADPRDVETRNSFLDAIFASALKQFAAPSDGNR